MELYYYSIQRVCVCVCVCVCVWGGCRSRSYVDGSNNSYTSWSPIRRGFASAFVNYKKGCSRLAAASDEACQLLAHGWWFSPGTLASSTTKTGRHDVAEILLKAALNTKNQSKSINLIFVHFVVHLNHGN